MHVKYTRGISSPEDNSECPLSSFRYHVWTIERRKKKISSHLETHLSSSLGQGRPINAGQDVEEQFRVDLDIVLDQLYILALQRIRVGGRLAGLDRAGQKVQTQDLHDFCFYGWQKRQVVCRVLSVSVGPSSSFLCLLRLSEIFMGPFMVHPKFWRESILRTKSRPYIAALTACTTFYITLL